MDVNYQREQYWMNNPTPPSVTPPESSYFQYLGHQPAVNYSSSGELEISPERNNESPDSGHGHEQSPPQTTYLKTENPNACEPNHGLTPPPIVPTPNSMVDTPQETIEPKYQADNEYSPPGSRSSPGSHENQENQQNLGNVHHPQQHPQQQQSPVNHPQQHSDQNTLNPPSAATLLQNQANAYHQAYQQFYYQVIFSRNRF